MRLIKHIVMALALLLAGCQVIPEDRQLLPLPSAKPVSNALLVEFTGFLCVNCPTAAEEAHSLLTEYPDNLIVVAMHPADNHFTQTGKPEYDYTCPEANEYYRYFGGTAVTPFPTGIVDMQQGWLEYPSWGTMVRMSVQDKKSGHLIVNITDINEQQRSFHVSASVFVDEPADEWIDKEMQIEVMLWLVADSVSGAQMMPDGSTNLSYTHRHMLRASLFDNPWGTYPVIVTGTECRVAQFDYVVTDTIGGQILPLDRYSVVAVLMDPNTPQTMLDVKQIKLQN